MRTETTPRSQSSTSGSEVKREPRRVKVTEVFDSNARTRMPIVIDIGGARSSKSYSIGQLMVQRFTAQRNKKILVTRKTGPALFLTAYALVISLLKDYGIYSRLRHDKSHWVIANPHNGCAFVFLSVDNPEKIKSMEYNYTWMEEANEFTWEDFLVIKTRMSGKTTPDEPNQIFMSLNPGEEQGWINQRVILSPAFAGRVEVIWSNYKMNPHLDDEYRRSLEDLKDQDADAYKIFAEGKFAQLTNVIYAPYEIVASLPDAWDEVIYGMDFGFNNPSALVRIGTRDLNKKWITQKIYRTKLMNSQLIELAQEVIPEEERDCPIYCDSAEPDRIAEFEAAGFNVFPADKQVKIGIDYCKRQKWHAQASDVDVLKERGIYKWRTDRNGNVLDEPVKFMDHAMDAKRYGEYTHNKDRAQDSEIRVTLI
jgi:phage terminase large subunit